MKKYIGITLYFIGLVGLSYTFFYISEKNKTQNEKNIEKTKDIINKTGNIVQIKQNTENTGIKDIIENIKKIDKVKNVKDNKKNKNTTGNISNNIDNNTDKEDYNIDEKDIVLEDIYVGLAHGKLVKDSKYEEIYDILNLSNLPLYKIEDKEIYIKKLKSIDYKTEKNIIQQLIHKIGGNIVETNLFGDKQLFVNIDVYYKVKSILLVEYDKNLYLVVLPYKKYKDYKSYLKNVLFAN